MVDLREINTETNEVVFDDFTRINHGKFIDEFTAYWTNRIAGETVNPSDMERFMKRGSAKNLSQLCKAKKVEGQLEALIGKKMDPGLMKMIVIAVIVGAGALIAIVVIKQLGLI